MMLMPKKKLLGRMIPVLWSFSFKGRKIWNIDGRCWHGNDQMFVKKIVLFSDFAAHCALNMYCTPLGVLRYKKARGWIGELAMDR